MVPAQVLGQTISLQLPFPLHCPHHCDPQDSVVDAFDTLTQLPLLLQDHF
jgi:hypothetical protein